MIFTLDLYAAVFLVCGLWMLLIFSYLSGRHVKMGDAEDPHNNLLRPENDVNVCNYNMFGLGSVQYNTNNEIKCYVTQKVHAQSSTLWRLCPHTLYQVLHDRRADKVLQCMVYISPIEGKPRTTVWGQAQTETLQRVFSEAINEWRRTLRDHEGHGDDFYGEDHEVRIVAIVEPSTLVARIGEHSPEYVLQPYSHLHSDVDTSGFLSAAQISRLSSEYTAATLRALQTPRGYGIDLSIVFESSKQDGTYAYVNRQLYENSGFVTGQCLTRGILIHINDTMGSGMIPYNPWQEQFIAYFAMLAVTGIGLVLLVFRELTPVTLTAALTSAAIAASVICTVIVPSPQQPVVDGHPERFSSDVFPISLLTHELGHTLLMEDHYQVTRNAGGGVVATQLPGPHRPFNCTFVPISIMGAENHITPLDNAFVNAMWDVMSGRTYTHPSGKWSIDPKADAEALEHGPTAAYIINDFKEGRDPDACADLSQINATMYVAYGGEGSTASGKQTDPSTCVTNGDLSKLMERSCWFNGEKDQFEPKSVCNVVTKTRVALTGNRYYVHAYMNIYAPVVEFFFVLSITLRFYHLWKSNQAENTAVLIEHGMDTDMDAAAEHLTYKRLVDMPTIVIILLWMLVSVQKASNVRRCIGVNDSIAEMVYIACFFLLLPMVPIIIRRLPFGHVLGLQSEEASGQVARRRAIGGLYDVGKAQMRAVKRATKVVQRRLRENQQAALT